MGYSPEGSSKQGERGCEQEKYVRKKKMAIKTQNEAKTNKLTTKKGKQDGSHGPNVTTEETLQCLLTLAIAWPIHARTHRFLCPPPSSFEQAASTSTLLTDPSINIHRALEHSDGSPLLPSLPAPSTQPSQSQNNPFL